MGTFRWKTTALQAMESQQSGVVQLGTAPLLRLAPSQTADKAALAALGLSQLRLGDIPNGEGPFVCPSKDSTLVQLAQDGRCRLIGSTSSISKLYFHINRAVLKRRYQLLPPELEGLFPHSRFVSHLLAPSINWIEPVVPGKLYALDARAERHPFKLTAEQRLVSERLAALGHSIERLMTDEAFLTGCLDPTTPAAAHTGFRFRTVGNVMLRSQLDGLCPETLAPVEVKARATRPYRYFAAGIYAELRDAPLDLLLEEFDLVRGIMNTWSTQLRIGNMRGLMLLHHDTDHLLHPSFRTLADIDRAAMGSEATGASVFAFSTWLVPQLHQYILSLVRSDRPVLLQALSRPLRDSTDMFLEIKFREAARSEATAQVDHTTFLTAYPPCHRLQVQMAVRVNGIGQRSPYALKPTDEIEVTCTFTPLERRPGRGYGGLDRQAGNNARRMELPW